jgi:hypothetical protein
MSERVELELKLKGGDKAVKTLGQLEQELDQARQAIKEVEVGSDAFNKLATQIQQASSEVKTLEKQMEGLEPQQKAEAFLKMGEGIAGGFAVAQGALALAGTESENLEKIQVKVQAAISIAMGVRMMSEAALMATTAKRVVAEKLALAQTKIGTALAYGQSVALGVWATAQGVLTGAVSATTAGMKLLRLAIAATGIGALVLAITAIGVAVYNWATATDATAEAQAKLNEKLVKGNEQFLKSRDLQKELAAAETDNEKLLVTRTNKLNDFIEGLKENNEKLKENAENLKNLNDFSKEEQRNIRAKTALLHTNNKRIQDRITLLDEQIVKTKEAIAADEEAARKEKERDDKRKQRREELKAQREKDAEDLRALQEEEKRLTLERIADVETRELALLQFEKDLQLEKIQDATNFEEQRLIIEERYARKRVDIQKDYVKETVDGLQKISTEGENILNELEQRRQEQQDKEREKYLQREQNKADFKASVDTQSFELAKAIGGKNEKLQKKIAIAETAFFTSKSIMRALADIPAPFGLIQAGIHGAMGIAQIANIKSEKIGDASGGGGGGTDIIEPMLPSSTGAFTLGGVEQPAVKAFVVESEITDSQAQMADINRRSTI